MNELTVLSTKIPGHSLDDVILFTTCKYFALAHTNGRERQGRS